MFSTKNIVSSVEKIPDEWIFSFYLKLSNPLTGRTVYLKSPFSSTDTRPSFCLYHRDGRYRFKDFSADLQGTAIDYVIAAGKVNNKNYGYRDAVKQILFDYASNPDFTVSIVEKKEEFNIVCEDYEARQWTSDDVAYWSSYKINSTILDRYNVKSLEYVVVQMYGDRYIYRSRLMYGFFNSLGDLCKVYRPEELSMRFIRLQDYILGSDQVNPNIKPVLVQSSLKDIMAMQSIGVVANGVAPEGESTILPKEYLDTLRSKGHIILTLFDPDTTGIKGMLKYKEVYGVPYVYIPKPDSNTKDIADIRKNYSLWQSRRLIIPQINKKL